MNPATPESQGTRLKVTSALRLHKLATIHCSSLARHLGVLESEQLAIVAEKLRALLGLTAETESQSG